MERVIGIIADDLTGANDSGVQLTEKGIQTSVLFDIPSTEDHLSEGIVIDTDSRSLNRQDAYDVTKKVATFLKKAGYSHIYKKIDSTLRGHLGAELEAIREVCEPEFLVVAPAFPPYGRTTKNGIHYLKGTKISDTEISRDPKHPVKESSIPKLLFEQTGKEIGLIQTANLRDDARKWGKTLSGFKKKGIHYLVCDAETIQDLSTIVHQIRAFTDQVVWSGSAGLAEVLPEIIHSNDKKSTPTNRFSCQQVLTVCGSLSEMTQQQVAFLANQDEVVPVEVDTVKIFENNWDHYQRQYIKQSYMALNNGKDVVLYVPSTEEQREQVMEKGKFLNLTAYQIGKQISIALSMISKSIVEENRKVDGLILTGGDTGKDVTRVLSAVGFHLIKEIEPGIPLGRLLGTYDDMYVVTKAGAFGEKDSLYTAMLELKGVRANEQETDYRYNHG
ncbi:four-carbon acid sugar kinase family protein [Terrihalobacillus insolitus]|uniref:four-carbon acid sugar kinase family protein n=1 Tax=Terrihalobacillus insolitus TaxID=2950438 RepID=UPI0023414711|nr:four-carbon acid sugar kinase family protein [Terrihalobacillus insolitus]MDC3415119.1 four-carbon acid sugar kinase family protein [Terrihalobacillus insolitus]